jgi:ferredoxin-nitrite reductase
LSGEEGYQVMLGGGSDLDQGLARELFPAVKFSDLPPRIHNLFSAYTQRAMTGESFLAFSRRHTIEELKAFCQPEELN